MARILDILEKSVQLRLDIDSAKRHLVELIASDFATFPTPATSSLSGTSGRKQRSSIVAEEAVSAAGSTLTSAVEVFYRRLVSERRRCGYKMDSCFAAADARCPVKFFHIRPPTLNHEIDHRAHRQPTAQVRGVTSDNVAVGRSTVHRSENKASMTAAASMNFFTPSRLGSSSVETVGDCSPSTIGRHRTDATRCQRLPIQDEIECDKENLTPTAGSHVVVSWLPPSGLKSTPSRTLTSSTAEIEPPRCVKLELHDAVSTAATTATHENVVTCQGHLEELLNGCDDRGSATGATRVRSTSDIGTCAVDAASEIDGIGTDLELLPLSLNNISVISRGVKSAENSIEHDTSAVDVSEQSAAACRRRMERFERLSPSRRHLGRSPSSLNGAFCSSFNADEPAFCSTFCYPLHSTVLGFDITEFDVSALVTEQLRNQQREQSQRKSRRVRSVQPSSDDSALELSWRSLSSGTSDVWNNDCGVATEKLSENNLRNVGVDSYSSNRDNMRVEVTKTPENPLCTECGRFHALVADAICSFPVVLHDSDVNERSTASPKRRRRDCGDIPAGAPRSTNRCLRTAEHFGYSQSHRALPTTSILLPDDEDLSSTYAADLDVTSGRMRRQMGLTKLYGGTSEDDDPVDDDDEHGDEKHIRLISQCGRSDAVTDDVVPLDPEKSANSSCFCRRLGHRCIVCRQLPNSDGQPTHHRFRVPDESSAVEESRSRTTSSASVSRTTAIEGGIVNLNDLTNSWSSSIWSTTSTTADMKFKIQRVDGQVPLSIPSTWPSTASTLDHARSDKVLPLPPISVESLRFVTGVTDFRAPLPGCQLRRRNYPLPPRSCECSHRIGLQQMGSSTLTRSRRPFDNGEHILHAGHQPTRCGWRSTDVDDHNCSYRTTDSASVTSSEIPSRRRHRRRYHDDNHRVGAENRTAPHRKLAVDVTSSWSTSTTSEQVHPSASTFCRRNLDNEDESVVASRMRKKAVVRKLKRFSDALYGSAGGLQLKIFGHV